MSDKNLPGFEYPIGTEVRISAFGRSAKCRSADATWAWFMKPDAQIWVFQHVGDWLTNPEAFYQYGIQTFIGGVCFTKYVTARMIERVPLGTTSRRLTVIGNGQENDT